MKKTVIFSLVIISLTIISSCHFIGSSPKKVFTTIGLNGNKIPKNFKRAFIELRSKKNNGVLVVPAAGSSTKDASAEEYITTYYSNMLDKDIEKIKALSSNEETASIIAAGLEMFQYTDEIYKTDYIRIAKLIDDNKSDEEIDAEIEKLEMTKGVELNKKYDTTMNLLLPYADKHGIEFKTIKL